MSRYPITEPETGEVLALDAEDAAEVRRLLAEQLVEHEKAARRHQDAAREVRHRLSLLLEVGDAIAAPGGWAVTMKPGASAKRQVNQQALQKHAEALRPLNLAPREPDTVPLVYPSVSALTTTKARAALARLNLTPETFLISGDAGEPSLVVIAPEEPS